MGGSNSRAENNAHIQSMANISNTRQRDRQEHELVMGRQALERQRQQLQAKTKEHEFKTELEASIWILWAKNKIWGQRSDSLSKNAEAHTFIKKT